MSMVGIIGASGFTGAELLRLCAGHPDFDVALATGDSQAGTPIASLYPSLAAHYGTRTFDTYTPEAIGGLDLVFLGLPHGASQAIVPELLHTGVAVVDLAADFRLHDAAAYPQWYGAAHDAPDLLDRFAYGLPELFRDHLVGATAVAAPGCYPTTATLALAPLLADQLVQPTGIIIDAASGVSGAGRAPKPTTTFCTVDENFTAYALLDHRHTPEIEQNLATLAGTEVQVLFTPHLAPMNRGILATCYARPTATVTTEDLLERYRSFYASEPFVTVVDGVPATKSTLGSNSVHVTVRADERTGWVIAIAALDNLVKGASGQAVQCANIITGLDEQTGLSTVGVFP
jgi:N-acetyl-gamma-glutamyl-phosphate reductase